MAEKRKHIRSDLGRKYDALLKEFQREMVNCHHYKMMYESTREEFDDFVYKLYTVAKKKERRK